MKVFVTGATGAIGRQLVPQLVEAGHEVIGTTRSERKTALIEEAGARAVVLDVLDADAVGQAVSEAQPDAIVHEATALAGELDLKRFDRAFAGTNRLRTEGTDHLLSAARAVGTKKFIAQSFAGWPFQRVGGPVKAEDAPLDPDPPKAVRSTLEAIRRQEQAVTGAEWLEGIALRYGGFYGPGTSMQVDPPGEQTEMVLKRRLPIVGSGDGVWSLIHVADAAGATVAALEHGERGVYHVVDDEPARAADLLPGMAELLGAKPPMRVPRWVGRLLAGEVAVVMMTELRGASNEKAKRELGWAPRYPSWRDGFAAAAAGDVRAKVAA
jgi:nucleoside-diphosphate-sugar epimerase